jgi:CDP-L-myo-inositol myo-inositolphosphotransferase
LLIVAGDLLVDQRLLDWLSAQSGNVRVAASREGAELLAVVDSVALGDLCAGRAAGLRVAPLGSFDPYVRKQRGNVPVHLLRVGEEDVERAWEVLFDHVEKRTKDLPAIYFDPPAENFLVRCLAPTPITPNQVTLFTGALGFFIAWLLLHGWLITGLVLAVLVEVLDGVDGKLARIKHMTSKLGELEHFLDFFYENSWYLALGGYFAAHGSPWAWTAAWIVCAADVADNLSYVYFARRVGGERWTEYLPSLDDSSSFLRRFRMVAGRRNIYVWLMLPGFVFGFAAEAFAVAVAWAAFTAATHWSLAHLGSRRPPAAPQPARPVVPHAVAVHAETHTRPIRRQSIRVDSDGTRSLPSGPPPRAVPDP